VARATVIWVRLPLQRASAQPRDTVTGPIRPLRRADIPQVASLYEKVVRSGSDTPAPQLNRYFERTLFEHPWVDPEIPSLVYLNERGRVAGFVASHVRRMAFDGRPIRAALSGQLVSDPAVRGRAAGTLLLRRFLKGPQDLSMTNATGRTTHIWKALGGEVAHLNSISWARPLNWRAVGEVALERVGLRTWKPMARPALSAVQAASGRIRATSLRVPTPPTRAEELTVQALLDQLPSVAGHLRLRPVYDEAFLEWLFDEMAAVTALGELTKCLVRDQRGRALGWYVFYCKRGGVGQVLQVAARERDAGAVLDHLFHHAQRTGVALLTGQLSPSLLEPLSRRWCFLHRVSGDVLVHARDPEIVTSVLAGQAFLSRMEGERWMGYSIQQFA
jgi:hypothetical protein